MIKMIGALTVSMVHILLGWCLVRALNLCSLSYSLIFAITINFGISPKPYPFVCLILGFNYFISFTALYFLLSTSHSQLLLLFFVVLIMKKQCETSKFPFLTLKGSY